MYKYFLSTSFLNDIDTLHPAKQVLYRVLLSWYLCLATLKNPKPKFGLILKKKPYVKKKVGSFW